MFKRFLTYIVAPITALITLAFWRWRDIRRKRIPVPSADSLIQNPDKDLWLAREDDQLLVRWNHPGILSEIRLFDSRTDETFPVKIHREQPGFARIDIPDLSKRYRVELFFENATVLNQIERYLPLKTVPNCRDIGGYKTVDGYVTCWNRVYRSSALNNLSPDDAQYFLDTGLAFVCDIRTAEEHNADPDQLPSGIPFANYAPSTEDSVALALFRLLFQAGFLENLLLDLYQRVMLQDNPQVFKQIFERLADKQNLPLLIHCANGKDRTGITIALLLSFPGVPDETIIADYAMSNAHYSFFKEATRKMLAQLSIVGLTESDFDYLLIADVEIMQKTLDTICETYGSVEQYLRDYVKISPATLNAIRYNLLEPVNV